MAHVASSEEKSQRASRWTRGWNSLAVIEDIGVIRDIVEFLFLDSKSRSKKCRIHLLGHGGNHGGTGERGMKKLQLFSSVAALQAKAKAKGKLNHTPLGTQGR